MVKNGDKKREIALLSKLIAKAIRSANQKPILLEDTDGEFYEIPSGIHILYLSIAGTGKSWLKRLLPNKKDLGKITPAAIRGTIVQDGDKQGFLKSRLVDGANKIVLFDESHRLNPTLAAEILQVLEGGEMEFALAIKATKRLTKKGNLEKDGYEIEVNSDKSGMRLKIRFSSIFFAEWQADSWDNAFKSRLFTVGLRYELDDVIKRKFLVYRNSHAKKDDNGNLILTNPVFPTSVKISHDMQKWMQDKFLTALKASPHYKSLKNTDLGISIASRLVNFALKFAADEARMHNRDVVEETDFDFFFEIWPLSVSSILGDGMSLEELHVYNKYVKGIRDMHQTAEELEMSEERLLECLNKLISANLIDKNDEIFRQKPMEKYYKNAKVLPIIVKNSPPKPRKKSNFKRNQIIKLAENGEKNPNKIAKMANCSIKYVYFVLNSAV